MPELPEVAAIADYVDGRAAGLPIRRVDVASLSVLKTADPPYTALMDRIVESVGRVGKYLVIRTIPGSAATASEPLLQLVIHLSRAGWVRWSEDLSPKPLPVIAKALPIGNPGELLRRRPDIQATERQLAAATAEVGVATADLFPRVSLSGFLGFTAGRGSQLGSSAARAWGVAPSISWAAFDLGSVRARLRGAEAEADGALSQYEQQVLLALEESENAFSDYAKRQQRLVSLVRQAEASRAAADQAAIRYREGTVDFLVLLDAERERLAAEDAQAAAEVELYSGIVAIYKALGGGWQPQA